MKVWHRIYADTYVMDVHGGAVIRHTIEGESQPCTALVFVPGESAESLVWRMSDHADGKDGSAKED